MGSIALLPFRTLHWLEKAMAHMVRIVRWEELSPTQEIDVESLTVSDLQIEYAGPTHRAVAACRSDLTGDIQGAAIFDGEAIVGFLVLKRRSAAPSWATSGAAVISALERVRHFA